MKNTATNLPRLHRFMAALTILLALFTFFSCEDLWGSRSNPLDTEADNYQGYPTATTADKISLASGWDGAWDLSTEPCFVCSDIVGATAYHLQVSASQDFSTSLAYDNDALGDHTVTAADLPGSLARGTTYWWRMRAFKGAWGPWSSALSFTYWPIAAVETPVLTPDWGKQAYGTAVSFSSTTEDATFHYTTDGTVPTPASTQGTGYTLTEAVTLRVMAVKAGLGNSAFEQGMYTIAASGLSLDRSDCSGYVGDRVQLEAVLTPATATEQGVTWASDASGVAMVTQLGQVEAIGIGEATITATSVDGGFIATCDFTVLDGIGVTGLDLEPSEATVIIDQTLQLTATVHPAEASNPAVTWASDNPDATAVSSSGLVTAIAAGTATITATTANGGFTQGCTITVPPMPVSGVILDRSALSIAVDNSLQLTATINPANATDKAVTWSSSDEDVATVSSSGLVNGISAGTATIAVTTVDGGHQAFCEATIFTVAVTGVTLNKTSVQLSVDGTESLIATISPEDATDKSLLWSSTNSSIATVSSLGLVTGISIGDATITVMTMDGNYTSSCDFNVNLITDISAGYYHTMILKADGSLWTTGQNDRGQLGDGSTFYKVVPVQVLTSVSTISAGAQHSLMIKSDGSLWGAGRNDYGQLGDGSIIDKSTPIQIMTKVASVSGGSLYTMILETNGTLWSTGYNYYGQLGDGSTIDKRSPVQIMTDVTSVSAGNLHTMILKTDGTLWGTGNNAYGQLGDGTTTNQLIPIQIMEDVASVSAGANNYTMILKTDGSLWATGYNYSGQLGDGTTINKSSPIQIMTEVAMVSSGAVHTMIVKTDGTLWATGNNNYGQFGNGSSSPQITPVQVMNGVKKVSTRYQHSIILKSDGSLWTTGWNSYGQLGDGTTTDRLTPVRIF